MDFAMDKVLFEIQAEVCARYGSPFVPAPSKLKVGISKNVRDGVRPLNGMRINPEDGTSGWFIWAGEERSDAADFFIPLHIEHLIEWAPLVIPYLALSPGWRFLVTEAVEDVWRDPLLRL
ncbi:immunity protein Imm33 domain-containing protein [Amantichitinum ursilacus]|uniref:Imm33-like domain-containing protein n=1 Tax=Amantichitinum ursilacus TaxID=857265 RepID=A0A0N0XKC1_9NEIS|nr:hypothetical protein [Amantichitinum ursilacus]KPC54577.1 hypothetical protein WG78_03360 [Amantichitinum ursilacus]